VEARFGSTEWCGAHQIQSGPFLATRESLPRGNPEGTKTSCILPLESRNVCPDLGRVTIIPRRKTLESGVWGASSHYVADIKMPKRFSMLVSAVALGASFRMAARFVQLVREETKMMLYAGCTDTLASSYARVVCASTLQDLSNMLCRSTGFSIALDSATLHGLSYLDVRVRFAAVGDLHNFHLLALPLYGAHTGALMRDALANSWTLSVPSGVMY